MYESSAVSPEFNVPLGDRSEFFGISMARATRCHILLHIETSQTLYIRGLLTIHPKVYLTLLLEQQS